MRKNDPEIKNSEKAKEEGKLGRRARREKR